MVGGLRARDMKDGAEIERFLDQFTDETLKGVYRRSLPVQLTMMIEAPESVRSCSGCDGSSWRQIAYGKPKWSLKTRWKLSILMCPRSGSSSWRARWKR